MKEGGKKQTHDSTVVTHTRFPVCVLIMHWGLLFLGCLQATPSISEAALVDPDLTLAPWLDLWQTGLATTGFRTVRYQKSWMRDWSSKEVLPEAQTGHHSCRSQSKLQLPGQAQGCSETVSGIKKLSWQFITANCSINIRLFQLSVPPQTGKQVHPWRHLHKAQCSVCYHTPVKDRKRLFLIFYAHLHHS